MDEGGGWSREGVGWTKVSGSSQTDRNDSYVPKDVEEVDIGAGCDAQRPASMRELHRGYRLAEIKRGCLRKGA